MPANDELKQEESAKDQPAATELEKKPEEIEAEDAETIAGGFGTSKGGDGP